MPDASNGILLIQVKLARFHNPFHRINVLIPRLTGEMNMDQNQMLAEIREANLTYLILAQSLIRQDRAEALFRLGLSEEAADLIGILSPAQIMKIASSNMLLCRFRVDDDMVWDLLTNHSSRKVESASASKLHANILMASKFSETM
jgi:flagellar transcriptional activator FlhD